MSTFGELAQILTIKNKVDGLRHTVDWLLKDKESLKKQVEIAKKALQEYAEISNWEYGTMKDFPEKGMVDSVFYKHQAYNVALDALNEMEQEQKQFKDSLLELIGHLEKLKLIEVVYKD